MSLGRIGDLQDLNKEIFVSFEHSAIYKYYFQLKALLIFKNLFTNFWALNWFKVLNIIYYVHL